MKNILLALGGVFFALINSNAQNKFLISDTAKDGTITYRKYNTTIAAYPLMTAINLLQETLNMQPDDSLTLLGTIQDKLGIEHQYYQQYYKGVKVENAEYLVHGKKYIIETINPMQRLG